MIQSNMSVASVLHSCYLIFLKERLNMDNKIMSDTYIKEILDQDLPKLRKLVELGKMNEQDLFFSLYKVAMMRGINLSNLKSKFKTEYLEKKLSLFQYWCEAGNVLELEALYNKLEQIEDEYVPF